MTWCDKLASTPTVGLKLNWYYATGNVLLQRLSPLIAHMNVGDAPAFGIDSVDEHALVFTTNEGFQYSATANRLSVGFASRVKLRQVSGGGSTLEVLSEAKPFSDLLPIVSDKLIEAALLLPESSNRVFSRVGVVSKTVVEEADYPPGITNLVEYWGRLWRGELDAYNFQLTARLGSDRGWHERCIHSISKVEGQDNVPTLSFDWQRTFTAPRPLTAKNLRDELSLARKSALAYFERLGDGSMFDDEVDSRKNRA